MWFENNPIDAEGLTVQVGPSQGDAVLRCVTTFFKIASGSEIRSGGRTAKTQALLRKFETVEIVRESAMYS